MRIMIGESMLEIVEGEISTQNTQAIVNAANGSLLGSKGLDGAILRGAGPQVAEEARALGGCDFGVAKVTSGGKLKAKHIIHTAGPVYRGGKNGEPELLARAYLNSMKLAVECGTKRIAFPAIGVGANGYPPEEAAEIAISTAAEFLRTHPELLLVRFALSGKEVYRSFEIALRKRIGH